ncbi:putative bifunctional diguanylate cyclase/phosphodiesterase [Clostridium massiliamazoniense]|uniref:putative bifunctional diguanylate cyclase/phosphodiesterase n=1 Tax=Clostridium massiliamazoniense TaxID=1347366 RepID=UPI0006D7BB6E|nr:EAL domain-containing protein [Clostridium massiliamazoniense]
MTEIFFKVKDKKYKRSKESITKDKLGLYFILLLLAIIFKLTKLDISFGIIIDFSSIFFILILLVFGFKKAIITTIVITSINVLFFGGEFIQFIDVLKIIILEIFCRRKWKLNLIVGEFIFWIIFAIPIIYSMVIITGIVELKEYYYFSVLLKIINGVFNVFFAEIIYLYIIEPKVHNKPTMFMYKKLIVHIVTVAILIPFAINIFADLNSNYNNICDVIESSSEEIYQYINDELKTWNEKSITNLKLSGIVEVGLMRESINKNSRYKPYNIHILGKNNNLILDIKNSNREITEYAQYNGRKITENLYKVLPIPERNIFNNSWIDGYFIYIKDLHEFGLKLMIEVPTNIYNEQVINEYLRQFKFLLFFTFFIGIISMLFNRTIFNGLYKLSLETKNLPEKLANNISIAWPKSKIFEISILTENIEDMSSNLRENFVKLNESQKKLRELAYYDILTGLPNKISFRNHLDELAKHGKSNKLISVIFVDLDRFKFINDNWGHQVGDELLIAVAKRFNKLKNHKFKVFRLGGDEFVFVLQSESYEEIKEVGKNISLIFKDSFKINELVIKSKCSMGASVYPEHSNNIDTIIKYADMAMYKSKENGGNYLQLFNDEIKEKFMEKVNIEQGINSALEKEEFILYYQPKFNKDRDIISLEALIRWQCENQIIISPDKFIPIAEESDLIFEIDKWVILNVCIENKRLQNEGYKKIPISVNISGRHFEHIEFLNVVKNSLELSGLESKYLKIEITESVLIKNLEHVSNVIIKLKKLGVNVSIDDFGKGYSSINQLMTLPIKEVKIDRDFISGINENYKKQKVVKLIVELAHNLGLNVVAEGIENKEEEAYLREIGCDELQGYLFSKPITIKELKKIL